MKALDYYLQRQRIIRATRWIPSGARVLDIGSHDGALFPMAPHVSRYVGIDPLAEEQESSDKRFKLIRGLFPAQIPAEQRFEAITMLAVLEHIPTPQQPQLARSCWEYLAKSGRLIITVPSPMVDAILAILRGLRLIDGMSLEEHFGFQPKDVIPLFTDAGFKLLTHRYFQFGLNNLFVFEKP